MARKRFKFNDLTSREATPTRQMLPGEAPRLPGGTA